MATKKTKKVDKKGLKKDEDSTIRTENQSSDLISSKPESVASFIDVNVTEVQEVQVVEDPVFIVYEEPVLNQFVILSYEGEKEKGLYEGDGLAHFVGGHKYIGQFCRGQMHGKGMYFWADGVEYTGEFTDNSITGYGFYKWPNGSRYEGNVLNGLRHGFGTHIFENGKMKYCGEWYEGRQHGKGRMDFDSAGISFYDGDWVCNVKQGYGVQHYNTGNIYEGFWYKNVRHGKGTMHWIDLCQLYSGDWEMGIQHGYGEYIWYLKRWPTSQYALRNSYKGDIRYGLREGCGTFFYANGACYEGEWKGNIKSGKGKFVFKNGRVYEGQFDKDRITEFPQFEMDGCSTPDISQIRTRTPLPSECRTPHSNASVNTYSPSFQLDVEYLLDEFDVVDREEEISQVVYVMLRHISSLHRIYAFYSRMGLDENPDNTFVLNQMQWWRLLKDCHLHHHNCGLIDMDRWLARRPECFPQMHDPCRQILFREFLNHLVVLAFYIYRGQHTCGPVLAFCLSHLLCDNVLKYACSIKGNFFCDVQKAMTAFGYFDEILKVYQNACKPNKMPEDPSITMRQFLFLLKDMHMLTKDLTSKKVIDILASDDPKVLDEEGAIILEFEMGFYDFFEALVGCAQQFITEDFIKILQSSTEDAKKLLESTSSMEDSQNSAVDPKVVNQPVSSEGIPIVITPSLTSTSGIMKSSSSKSTGPRSGPKNGSSSRIARDKSAKSGSSIKMKSSQTLTKGSKSGSSRSSASSVGSKEPIKRDGSADSRTPSPVSPSHQPDERELADPLTEPHFYEPTDDREEDYGMTPGPFIDESVRLFNLWTNQLHLFFVSKFFPSFRQLSTIGELMKTSGC